MKWASDGEWVGKKTGALEPVGDDQGLFCAEKNPQRVRWKKPSTAGERVKSGGKPIIEEASGCPDPKGIGSVDLQT